MIGPNTKKYKNMGVKSYRCVQKNKNINNSDYVILSAIIKEEY